MFVACETIKEEPAQPFPAKSVNSNSCRQLGILISVLAEST